MDAPWILEPRLQRPVPLTIRHLLLMSKDLFVPVMLLTHYSQGKHRFREFDAENPVRIYPASLPQSVLNPTSGRMCDHFGKALKKDKTPQWIASDDATDKEGVWTTWAGIASAWLTQGLRSSHSY